MNITAIVLTILGLVQTVLPLLIKGGDSTQIDNIINMLAKLVPTVIQGGGQLYTAFKNITGALAANPAAIPEQLAKLQALDAVVDAAFDKAAADVDPDATSAG